MTALSNPNTIIITIDGPAGAGKSTIARALARELGYSYLDTGAMYRSLTCKALRLGLDLQDEYALVNLARGTRIEFQTAENGQKVLLDGEDVSGPIRSLEVTNSTFYIARAPGVRAIMVQWQQTIGQRQNVVVEGRDTGTVVFPHATCKFYLDASVEERASRRIKELREQGKDINEAQLLQEIKERDHKDFTRSVGPLKKADDAIVIDSTGLSIPEVVSVMKRYLTHG